MATFTPSKGYLINAFVRNVTDDSQSQDPTNIDLPTWWDNFSETIDIGVFAYIYTSGVGNTGVLPTKNISLSFIKDYVFNLIASNSTFTPDYCDVDLEFLDASDNVIAAIRLKNDGSWRHGMWYGASLASLTKAGQVGSSYQTDGKLSFTASAMVYTNTRGTNHNASWSFACNPADFAKIRVSSLRVQSSYTSAAGGAAYFRMGIDTAPPNLFSGDFAALTPAQYTALNPDLYLPSGAAIGHQQGVGLTASGTAPSYVLSRGVLPGQTGVLFDSNNQVMARLSYLGGIASLTVGGVTTTAPCTEPHLNLTMANGQAFAHYQDRVVVRSVLFVRPDLIPNVVRPWLELQPGQTLATIWLNFYPLDVLLTYTHQPGVRVTAIPANQETRAQFQPQDVAWRGSPGYVYAGPMPAVAVPQILLCQGQDLTWVRDGNQNVAQGYIESTVTIDGEGVRRRVLCLDQAGNLIGETYSRASDGKYRFDLLWLNRRYMLVAQDDPAFGPADYNAVAADFQLPTPYAPGEGVGLV